MNKCLRIKCGGGMPPPRCVHNECIRIYDFNNNITVVIDGQRRGRPK